LGSIIDDPVRSATYSDLREPELRLDESRPSGVVPPELQALNELPELDRYKVLVAVWETMSEAERAKFREYSWRTASEAERRRFLMYINARLINAA
jgi:hypothetical protein